MKDRVTIISCCEFTDKSTEGYDRISVRMVYSLRKNGGSLKDSPVVMWYAEDRPPRPEYAAMLKALGCTLVQGACVMPEHRVYNKITAMGVKTDTEYNMWLDSDIFITKDLGPILDGDPDISTSPTTYCFHKWANLEDKPYWDVFYLSTGIINPDLRIDTDIDGKPGLFYLCSGVVLFKNGINFPHIYSYCVDNILNSSVKDRYLNFSQTGLSIAVVEGGYKFKKLDERFQLVYSLRKTLFEDTAIVHYQDSRVIEISDFEWSAAGLLN